MTEAGRKKVLGLIGLGVRARTVVVGVAQVRAAAARGKLVLAVLAPDASGHSRAKVLPLLSARHIGCIEGPSAAELGQVVGRETTAAVGVIDAALAQGIREAAHAAVQF